MLKKRFGKMNWFYLDTEHSDLCENQMSDESMQSKALNDFATWSNCMLVTSTAAATWTANLNPAEPFSRWTKCAVACLVLSSIFGIFTIAIVPLVRQKIGNISIYEVKVQPTWFRECTLESFCFFQHLFLILGLLFFVAKVFN